MAFITLNSNIGSTYREEILLGREHIVVPVTMIVPGVLNGSAGAGYYSKQVISKRPQNWNNMPIVAPDHPVKNGKAVSARNATILNEYGIGVVLNAEVGDNLTAEAWLDKARTEKVDARILWSIYNNEPIEISTGLDLIRNKSKGKFKDVEYEWTANNLQPDHLAILTNTIGACSIKDGCGLLINKLSHDQIRALLQDQLKVLHADPSGSESRDLYIVEVYPTEVIYEINGELRSRKYARNQKDVTFADESFVVRQKTSYEVVNHVVSPDPEKSNSHKKGSQMDKEKLISSIINSGCDCWTAEDQETLNGFSDAKLTKIHEGIVKGEADRKIVNSLKTGVAAGDFKVSLGADSTLTVNAVGDKPEPKTEPVSNKLTLDDMPEEFKTLLAFAQNAQDSERQTLIANLASDDEAKRAELKDKTLDELKTINRYATSAKPVASQSFKGRGGVAPVNNSRNSDDVGFDDSDALYVNSFDFSGDN